MTTALPTKTDDVVHPYHEPWFVAARARCNPQPKPLPYPHLDCLEIIFAMREVGAWSFSR